MAENSNAAFDNQKAKIRYFIIFCFDIPENRDDENFLKVTFYYWRVKEKLEGP
jgi:hypothetical protein